MVEFKKEDIVVVENSSDCHLPINSVVQIGEEISPTILTIKTFQKNTYQLLTIFLQDYNGKLRLATQREQFLYHILGPHVLKKE